MSHKAGPTPATVVYNLDAANFSGIPATGGSSQFSGSNSLSLSPGVTIGNGSYTIEGWFQLPNFTNPYGLVGASATNGLSLYVGNSTSFVTDKYGGGGSFTYTVPTMSTNTWYHFALVRNGSTSALFLNGTRAGATQTDSLNYSAPTVQVGAYYGLSWPGYITNLRAVVGNNVYDPTQSTITVPTAPLIIYKGVGNSGSAQFSGTNYLSSSVPFSMGSGAYTVECFVYLTATVSSVVAILGATVAGGSNGFSLAIANMTTIQTDRSGSASNQYTIPTLALNTWHHIVATRSSTIGQETVFVNGVKSSTGYGSAQNYAGNTGYVGNFGGSAWPFTGYISQLRVVVGSNVYDPTQSTITVPTSALTSVANTKLLLLFASSGALLTDTSGTQTMTNTGSVAWSQTGPFGVSSTKLLLQVATSGSLTTDTSGVNTVTNNGTVAFNSSSPFASIKDATGTYTITSSNAGSSIAWNSANGGSWVKSSSAGTDYILGGPQNHGSSYSVFMAYKVSATSAGRLLNTGNETTPVAKDWLMGAYNGFVSCFYPNISVNLPSSGTDTVWHLDFATWDNSTGTGKLYAATSTAPVAVSYTATNAGGGGFNQLRLFSRAAGTEVQSGNIAVVKVWSGVLTLAQIQNEYATYKARFGY